MADDELTPEKLAEQIRLLKIEDLLLSTVSTLGQLAYAKLDAKELDQARLAIDAIAALLPALEGRVGADVLRDFRQLLANVRLAFANAASVSGSEQPPPGGGAAEPAGEEGAQTAGDGPAQEPAGGSEPRSREG